MKFFVPPTKEIKGAKKHYKGLKKLAQEKIGYQISDRKIYSISHIEKGHPITVEVGKPYLLNNQIVIAIFESEIFLIQTLNIETIEVYTFMVNESEVLNIIDFEDIV